MKNKKKNWFHRNKTAILICIIGFVVCYIPFAWSDWFFGVETTVAETVRYVGTVIGGILLAVNAYFIYKRADEQARSNHLTIKGQELIAKGQLDMRFKDAAMLLARKHTSAELSGIHALHQIAIEASKTDDQKDYVKVIKDILTAFIKENSVIEYKKNENEETLFDEFENPIVEKSENKKSQIVMQAIVDKLFIDKSCKIYDDYPTDLSETVLKGVNFRFAQLQSVDFENAQLQNADFRKAQLLNAKFSTAQLQNVNFKRAHLQNVDLRFAQLRNAYFEGVTLQDANFENAYDIDKANFENMFWNKHTNFKGTAFQKKSIEELTKIMGRPIGK